MLSALTAVLAFIYLFYRYFFTFQKCLVVEPLGKKMLENRVALSPRGCDDFARDPEARKSLLYKGISEFLNPIYCTDRYTIGG